MNGKNYFNYGKLINFCARPKYMYLILSILIFFISVFHVFLGNQIRKGMDIALGTIDGSLLQELVVIFAIVLLYSILIRIKRPFAEKLAVDAGKSVLLLVYEKIYRLPQLKWDEMEKGDVFTLLESDIRVIREHFPKHLLPLFIEIMGIIFGYVSIFMLSPLFFAISFFGGIPLVFLIKYFSKRIEKNAKSLQKNTGNLNTFFDEEFENNDITRVFKSKDYVDGLYDRHFENRKQASVKNMDLSGKLQSFSLLLAQLPNVIIILMGIMQINAGNLTFGELTATLTILSNVVLWPMTRLPESFATVFKQKASFERCSDFLNLEEGEKKNRNILKNVKRVSVKDLNFSYTENQVLFDINLYCEKGEIILIKGSSGSGKTTLMKLLLGLFEPESGEVFLETENEKFGINFGYMAYVPQDNFIIEGLTLGENIEMSKGNGNLELAVQLSVVGEFSNELNDGLNTCLDESRGFSKGQFQRVAIARAVYRNSDFLVFDEPFSALDEKNMRALKENLKLLSKDRGIIIISHRETGEDFADRIYKLENGRMV